MLCCFFIDATITLLFNSKRKIQHFFLLQTTKNYHSTIPTVFNWIIYTIVPIMNDRPQKIAQTQNTMSLTHEATLHIFLLIRKDKNKKLWVFFWTDRKSSTGGGCVLVVSWRWFSTWMGAPEKGRVRREGRKDRPALK
jgi:hypothetical protein